MRRAYLALPLLLLSCGDSDLQKVAKGLQIAAESVGTLQTTVIEANKLALLTEDETRTTLEICVEINKAGKDAVAVTRGLVALDSTSKSQILTILTPVIKSVDAAVGRSMLIKNEDTRAKIRTILLTIQSALNSVQLIVGVT